MCTRWQSKYPFHLCLSLIFGFQSMSRGEEKKDLLIISPNKYFYYYIIVQCSKKLSK